MARNTNFPPTIALFQPQTVSITRLDDVLMVEARVHHVGRSSWTVAFTIRSIEEVARTEEQDSTQTVGEIVAEGKMTIVAMDPTTERAKSLPDDLRRALAGIDT